MTRAIIVRHAQSEANQDALLSSRPPGAPLTRLGHEQAVACARSLAHVPVERIYASPLRRTQQTARLIGDALDVSVTTEDDLREFGLGEWEGRPGTDGDVLDHPVFLGWLRQENLDQRFEGGESGREVGVRLQRVLERANSVHGDGAVVLVTHGGLIAVGVPFLTAQRPVSPRIPANGEYVVLADGNPTWAICEPPGNGQ